MHSMHTGDKLKLRYEIYDENGNVVMKQQKLVPCEKGIQNIREFISKKYGEEL